MIDISIIIIIIIIVIIIIIMVYYMMCPYHHFIVSTTMIVSDTAQSYIMCRTFLAVESDHVMSHGQSKLWRRLE